MVDESMEAAEWCGPVADDVITPAEGLLGSRLPRAWRAYLQSPLWLRRGWLDSGDYVHLYDPHEALELLEAWGKSTSLHPGIYFLGGDGSRSMYCIDLREADPAVQLTDIVSGGWHEAEVIFDSVEQFVQALRDGTFRAFPDQ